MLRDVPWTSKFDERFVSRWYGAIIVLLLLVDVSCFAFGMLRDVPWTSKFDEWFVSRWYGVIIVLLLFK